jgi:hypothetical protein
MLNFTLMHKQVAVMEIDLDEATGTIAKVGLVHELTHLPVGIKVKHGIPDRTQLNNWWISRSIPASRQGIQALLADLQLESTHLLLDKSFGLSLSDHYWIRPTHTTLQWAEVNFFDNPFSEDIGNLLFGKRARKIDLLSPDNTSDGWLRKKWIIADNQRLLVKGGSGPYRQEPLNEVLATTLMERLGIPHVAYTVTWDGGELYSFCENFLTPETELVSAGYIMRTRKQENHTSAYQHFLACCDALHIPAAREAIDQMLVTDTLIVNSDRHYGNFGAVRNADTLEWLGIAPIYDSGTSMWYDTPTQRISNGAPEQEKAKPFRKSHSAQLALTLPQTLASLDFTKLADLAEVAKAIYSASPALDAQRVNRLCDSLMERVQHLEKMQRSYTS